MSASIHHHYHHQYYYSVNNKKLVVIRKKSHIQWRASVDFHENLSESKEISSVKEREKLSES